MRHAAGLDSAGQSVLAYTVETQWRFSKSVHRLSLLT